MQSLTGAILFLTAAVLFGSGAIANAIRKSDSITARDVALVGGVILGFVGFIVLVDGLNPKRPRTRHDQQSAPLPRGDAGQQ